MPPNRIASSFAEAQEYGLPLSSNATGKNGPSIARGQACQTCRRRKLRCDGIRPLCTSCRKSAIAHGDNVDLLACKYDSYEVKKPRKKREQSLAAGSTGPADRSNGATADESAKVAELEAQIVELKNMMATAGLGPETQEASNSNEVPVLSIPSQPGVPFAAMPAAPWMSVDNATTLPPSLPTFSASTRMSGHTGQHSPPPSGSSHGASSSATSPMASGPASLFDLFYPGWPKDLPSPDLTSRLIEIFFTRPHAAQMMVNASRFRTAMLLSPTHPSFPQHALIHVICAIAAMIISPAYFDTEEPYWHGHAPSASEYHYNMAKIALEQALSFGSRLFEIAQANVLITYWAYNNARFISLWVHCGMSTRFCTPLGLNHLRAASDAASLPTSIQGKGSLLPKTDNQADLVEQASTFYGAIMADRFSSASTGWAVSLDEEDYSTPIPGLQGFPTCDVEESVLSPRNPSFFVAHPPHLVGPQQLYLKSIVLLGKVVIFSHRAPFAAKFAKSHLNDSVTDIRTTDAFRRLDAACIGFIASIPREFQIKRRAAMGIKADVLTEVNLSLVHSIAHSSYILLHEPHVSSFDDSDESMQKSLASANEILQAIFLSLSESLTESVAFMLGADLHRSVDASTEISLYSPYINYCWAVAARTFIRKMAMLQIACRPGSRELRSNVETILACLEAHETPLGNASATQVRAHLEDPYRALPVSLQAQARRQAGVPEDKIGVMSEMATCAVMLQSAQIPELEARQNRFGSTSSPSEQYSPPTLTELNSGHDPLAATLNPMPGLAGRMDDAQDQWSREWPSPNDEATGAPLASFLTEPQQPSPMSGIDHAAPSPSSAGLSSSSGTSSLFDFANFSNIASGPSMSTGAPAPDMLPVQADVAQSATAFWESIGGLQAIEALLKIQQAALG